MKNNKLQNEQISQLHNNTQRQIFITKLVKQAKINPASLPRGKNDKLLLNFNDLLRKLNAVLIGQYLQKQNLSISKSDMILIQNSDSQLVKIKERIEKNDEHSNDKFCIIQDILFKNSIMFDEIVPRLCLPAFLGREVLSKLHARNHCHLGGVNLLTQFNNQKKGPRFQN